MLTQIKVHCYDTPQTNLILALKTEKCHLEYVCCICRIPHQRTL